MARHGWRTEGPQAKMNKQNYKHTTGNRTSRRGAIGRGGAERGRERWPGGASGRKEQKWGGIRRERRTKWRRKVGNT